MKLVNIVGDINDIDHVVSALGETGDNAAEFNSDSESLIPLSSSDEYTPLLEQLRRIMSDSGIEPKIVRSDKYDDADIDSVRLVIGHHPHCPQPVEEYNGHYIYYSFGNWTFGGNTNPRDKDTLILHLTVERQSDGTVQDGSITNCKLSPNTQY